MLRPSALVKLLLCSLLCAELNAFAMDGKKDACNIIRQSYSRIIQSAFTMTICLLPMQPASAVPTFDELIRSQNIEVMAYNPSLSDTDAFKQLPRQKAYTGAVKELMDLQEMQDTRLSACEDKGKFWEQCFMYGQSNDGISPVKNKFGEDRGRMDNQLISPTAALNPPSDSTKIPTW